MTSAHDDTDGFGMGIESLFSETFGMLESSLFDLATRSLQPLYHVKVSDDDVVATFDLPGVRRDDVTITCTEDSISLEATMTRPVRVRVSRGRREGEEFVRYSRKVLLPVRVDPERGTAKFRNCIAVVTLPRLREGKPFRIAPASDKKRSRR
jgi:HSP20 family protein